MHPQVLASFIKCDRNSTGTSEKADPIWRKDAWNGGMAEYPKHRMAENAYIERFQLLQLSWIIPEKKHCDCIMFYDTSHILSLKLVISRFRIFGRSMSDFKILCHSVIPPNRVTHQETLATRKKFTRLSFRYKFTYNLTEFFRSSLFKTK